MNKKFLFIVHDLYQNDNEFPIGIGYLAAVLKNKGVDVTICSQDLYHYDNEQVANKFLKNEEYDFIGIGFLAARFTETVLPLCKVINEYKKDAKLILGGQGPSPIPEYILKTTKADIIAIGEAEETVIDLLSKDLKDIKGIAYRIGDNVHINERREPVKDLDSLPIPAYELFPMNIYTTNIQYPRMKKGAKGFQILTSRGCSNRCTFCYRMEKGIRFRSIKKVVKEIKFLYEKYGVTYFNIQDELFAVSQKRLNDFINELKKEHLDIHYDCNLRANTITEDMVKLLKETGCYYVNIGFESVNQKCLDELKKHVKVEDNYRAAELVKKYDVPTGLNIIWGAPSDNEQTLKDGVSFIKRYNTYDVLRTIRPITPYPGSEMYYDAIQKGLLKGPEDFFERFKNSDLITVNFTKLTNEEAYKHLYDANKELILDHYNHINDNNNEAKQKIESFYNLYFKGFTQFRGARSYEKIK